MIDRRNPLPLWAQLLEDLRTRLQAGEFASRFPTDSALVKTYGVSRQTVRDAVRRLQNEGLLERERGRGTFVRNPAFEQPMGTLYSLFRSIEDQGFEQRSIVRALEERTNPEAAEILELRAGAPLVYLERVRLAAGTPIAVDWSWLPSDIAGPLLGLDFTHTALYAELVERCGVGPTSGWERVTPAVPTAAERRTLDIGPKQAVFSIERFTMAAERPLEWRHTVVRGDLYAFVARWSGASLNSGMEPTAAQTPEPPSPPGKGGVGERQGVRRLSARPH